MPKPSSLPHIDIYTDGGADPNPGPGGWGAILISGLRTKEISDGEPDTTNNRMELTAAISALGLLKEPCEIDLYTDSQYLRKGITQWVDAWIDNGWRKRNGRPVENVDLWQALVEQAERHRIEWHWVKGHRGNPLNERADQLATEARRKLVRRIARYGDKVVAAGERQQPAQLSAVSIYTRGCALGVPGPSGYAGIVVNDERSEEVVGSWPLATNNQMELWAVIASLRQLKTPSSIELHTTSKYVLEGATRWLASWEKRNWMTASGKPVKNQEVWRELSHLLGDHDVHWVLDSVEERAALSHRASQLARQAAEQRRDAGQ